MKNTKSRQSSSDILNDVNNIKSISKYYLDYVNLLVLEKLDPHSPVRVKSTNRSFMICLHVKIIILIHFFLVTKLISIYFNKINVGSPSRAMV